MKKKRPLARSLKTIFAFETRAAAIHVSPAPILRPPRATTPSPPMRKRYAGLLVCVSVAVLLASWTGDAAAKSIDDDASVVENSSSTSTSTSSLDFQHLHRGRTSLVSHWLDSTLGSSEGIILSSRLHKHKRHGNSSRPSGGGGSGKRSDDDHKPLLPLNARDLLGLFAASIAILLASGSGIGGGGLLVPIFLLIFGFGTRDSVALSNLTILGGSAVSLFFFNLARRHPRHRDRPLIDWDIILVMEPST